MASVFDPHQQQDDLDSKLVASLERLAQALRVLLWDQAKTHGLSPIQVQFLVYLHHHPERDRRVSTLAQAFDLTKPTVSDAVKTLETKGYLERRNLTHDRRAAVLELTPAGTRLTQQLESWAEAAREPLRTIPDEQKQVTLDTILHLITSLHEAGVITTARMCRTCRFFRANTYAGDTPHHCSLLDKPLAEKKLRFDCHDHEPNVRHPVG